MNLFRTVVRAGWDLWFETALKHYIPACAGMTMLVKSGVSG
jgi:hypothetical protein